MEKTEIAKEQISGLEKEEGGKEKLLELKKHLDEALARMQESEEKAKNKVIEMGGSAEVLNEKTADVDSRIDEVKNVLEKVNGGKILKIASGAGYVKYQEFDRKFGVNNSLSKDYDSGSVLPTKEGLQSVIDGNANPLKKFFDIDREELVGVPFDQLRFKPAKVDKNGELVSKGEIAITSGNENEIQNESIETSKDMSNDLEENRDYISYKEFDKKFKYFDKENGTSLVEGGHKDENIFSYDSGSGRVLPLKEGWELAKTNSRFYLDKSFNYNLAGDKWNTPFSELRFKPAIIDKDGKIIKKGEILSF